MAIQVEEITTGRSTCTTQACLLWKSAFDMEQRDSFITVWVHPKEKPSLLCGFFLLCLKSYWLSSNPLYVFVTRFTRNQIIAVLLHKPLARLREISLCWGHSGLLHFLLYFLHIFFDVQVTDFIRVICVQ